MEEAQDRGELDKEPLLRELDPRQRKALTLFQKFGKVKSHQIGDLFGFKPRTASKFCHQWVEAGFLEIVDPSNKARTYRLAKNYEKLIHSSF